MSEIKFKPLHYFYLAAVSLLASGLLMQEQQDWKEWFFLIWSTFTGIFLTYRFNDFIDGSRNFEFNFKKFFSNKLHIFVVIQLILILTPLSFIYLSYFRFILLCVLGFFGFLYSVKFDLSGKTFRIKHIFIVKNLLIGLCWGGLVLLGSDSVDRADIFSLFLFCTIQVFIGSTIRDITDLETDTTEYVNSLPVVLGVKKTLIVLNLLNLFALISPYFLITNIYNYIPIIITFLWRTIVLYKLVSSKSKNWSQKYNLLTCFTIFIGQLIAWTF
jgi:4-hydroxybenzoate polyprenyltransferase